MDAGVTLVKKGLRSHHGKSGEANRLLDQCGVLDCVVGREKGLQSHHGESGGTNRLLDPYGGIGACELGRLKRLDDILGVCSEFSWFWLLNCCLWRNADMT